MGEVIRPNINGFKTIQADDTEYLPSNPMLSKNPLTIIGAELSIPIDRLRIISTEFERSGFFPDAVALVQVIEGEMFESGDHLKTPWGVVKIA